MIERVPNQPPQRSYAPRFHWTDEEIAFLRANRTKGAAWLAKQPILGNHSENSIRVKMSILGLSQVPDGMMRCPMCHMHRTIGLLTSNDDEVLSLQEFIVDRVADGKGFKAGAPRLTLEHAFRSEDVRYRSIAEAALRRLVVLGSKAGEMLSGLEKKTDN